MRGINPRDQQTMHGIKPRDQLTARNQRPGVAKAHSWGLPALEGVIEEARLRVGAPFAPGDIWMRQHRPFT